MTAPPWEHCPPSSSFHRELVSGRPTLVWYQPDGTRVVSEGHTLVSQVILCPVSGPREEGEGRLEGAIPGEWEDTAYPHPQASLLGSNLGLAFQLALMFLCCRRTAATMEKCRATPTPGSLSAPAPGSGTRGQFHEGGESERKQGMELKSFDFLHLCIGAW